MDLQGMQRRAKILVPFGTPYIGQAAKHVEGRRADETGSRQIEI